MALSRRDSTIVARHEVPGIMRKIARPSGTIERLNRLYFQHQRAKRPTGEQKTAQGFSPGDDTHKEIALKRRPNQPPGPPFGVILDRHTLNR
jgi:hypothetical protein